MLVDIVDLIIEKCHNKVTVIGGVEVRGKIVQWA